jgi:N-acetylmuramoyl-L-alanine amidase
MNIVDLRGKLQVHATRKYPKRKLTEIHSIAEHHSLTFSGSPESFARYHVETNGWPGIAYAYVIGRDGTIYWCNDWDTLTYHVGNSNRWSIGICMVGDFRTQKPTEAQYAAALELTKYLKDALPNVSNVLGHSQYPGYSWKECPVISMDQFRKDVEELYMIEKLEKRLRNLENQVEVLEATRSMPVPKWAKSAVAAAVKNRLIDTPDGGSYDFYRTITILHRKGLI